MPYAYRPTLTIVIASQLEPRRRPRQNATQNEYGSLLGGDRDEVKEKPGGKMEGAYRESAAGSLSGWRRVPVPASWKVRSDAKSLGLP